MLAVYTTQQLSMRTNNLLYYANIPVSVRGSIQTIHIIILITRVTFSLLYSILLSIWTCFRENHNYGVTTFDNHAFPFDFLPVTQTQVGGLHHRERHQPYLTSRSSFRLASEGSNTKSLHHKGNAAL